MATDQTRRNGLNDRSKTGVELINQLDTLLEQFESVNWPRVRGITTAEAAVLSQRLQEAREATQELGCPNGHPSDPAHNTRTPTHAREGAAFDARDVATERVDDVTVRQATEGCDA